MEVGPSGVLEELGCFPRVLKSQQRPMQTLTAMVDKAAAGVVGLVGGEGMM